jgi:WhiB family redox-sensing transcriptional regulator
MGRSSTHGELMDAAWASIAKCRDADPDALFVRGAKQQLAKQVCQGCPVIAECLADALDSRIEFGVWGGKTERERRALLRAHPEVTSWWDTFARARQRQAS